jgi:hypothetical protein
MIKKSLDNLNLNEGKVPGLEILGRNDSSLNPY